MRIGTKQTGSKVEFLNLLSTDVAVVELMWYFAAYLIVGPIKICLIIVILVRKGDTLMLSGLLLFFLVIPIQFGLSFLSGFIK